jgi:ribonucleoside-triphosphate reductase (thioredoxin)
MSLTELKAYTFTSRYARWNKEKKRRETWGEACDRVENMMMEKYANFPAVHSEIKWAYSQMRKKRVLGSQRALQFGGEPILKRNLKIFNCISSYCDRPRFFQECMYLLLCGCGTGFSVQRHHIAKLPDLVDEIKYTKKFIVEDSIEGWSDALGVLIGAYLKCDLFPEYSGRNIEFDFSKIRPAGAELSYGGKAPGPKPLKRALEKIESVLKNAQASQKKLEPIQCYDIVMHAADSVIAGGVRRSATICMFSEDDAEMMSAKTGNWFYENPQRGRSNNSVVLLRDECTQDKFCSIIEKVKEFGEPGFVLTDSKEELFNPCVEVSLYGYNDRGESGWEACNLSTINGKSIKDEEGFYECCRAAAIIGTLQAGFTEPGYLTVVSQQIMEREALIGVSMTGIMDNPDICLSPRIQRAGANLIKQTNKKIATMIGINPAARTTVVKPEGTASCVLGTSSGIHPHHARRYIRRVQANKYDEVYKYFNKINPKACTDSVWSSNDTDDVISFCIEVPDGAKIKNQMGAIELLKNVQSTQKNWVTEGRDLDLCVQPWLNHNVSNTINVKPEEWEEVAKYIYKNRQYFCGISLLPISGDKDFAQAPFTSIYLPRQMLKQYGDGIVFCSGLIEEGKKLWDDNLWTACDAIMGIIKCKGQEKKRWLSDCVKFATNYFDGDLRKLTYAMKDIDNFKLWTELQSSYQGVNYENMFEDKDNTKLEETVACSGGACELV